MTKPMIQMKDEWLTALIELNKRGKLSDASLLAALKFSNDMWGVNPPGLDGNTGDIISRIQMTRAVYYRHVRELQSTGFIVREHSHRIVPTMPVADEPIKDNTLSSW